MFDRKLALFFICLLGLVSGTTNAQTDSRIRGVVPSIDHIENDLKWLVEQAPTADLRKQWKTLKEDILDSMTQGVDLSKPVLVDVVVRKEGLEYEFRIPLKDLAGKNGFIKGLEGIGYKVKEVTKGTYFEFNEKGQKPYYLRFDKDFAWISKNAIPATLPLATLDMAPLLALDKDVVVSLKNDGARMNASRATFKELRKQTEAMIKARRNEDPAVFELRKLATVQQADEAERFIVESEELIVSWKTSTEGPNPTGRGEFSITALPGTDLLKSIQEFAVKPSYFANVTLHASPIASGKLNFALDSLRAGHLKDFYKAVRPTTELEIDKLKSLTAPQKTATKQAMNKFVDMLDAGLPFGVVDGFVDGHKLESGKNVLVCGIRSADGKVADEILKLLPQMDPEWKLKPEPEEYGRVSIYELTIPKSKLAAFQKIFAGEAVIYVGTSKDAVWGAAGLDAVKYLKEAIDQTALPAPEKADPVVVSYQYQLDQLINILDLVQNAAPAANADKPNDPKDAKEAKERRQREKDLEKYRKLAQDTMSNCNSLMQGELRRTGDKIEGHLELNECVLRFIGAMIADGVKTVQ